MQCTACNEGKLEKSKIDDLFDAHTCSHCGGHWILIKDFLAWKENNPDFHFDEALDYEQEAVDSVRALFCPVSGVIMSKFKVSSQNGYRIDYSASVGGVWLDKGEWDMLKKDGVAQSLNSIATNAWQHKLRMEEAAKNFSDIYKAKFGEENYLKLKEIREWLIIQPQSIGMKNYLVAVDPYSAEK